MRVRQEGPDVRERRRHRGGRREQRQPARLLPREGSPLHDLLLPRQGARRPRDAGDGRQGQPLRARAGGRQADEVLTAVPVERRGLRQPRASRHDAAREEPLHRPRSGRAQHSRVHRARAPHQTLVRRRPDLSVDHQRVRRRRRLRPQHRPGERAEEPARHGRRARRHALLRRAEPRSGHLQHPVRQRVDGAVRQARAAPAAGDARQEPPLPRWRDRRQVVALRGELQAVATLPGLVAGGVRRRVTRLAPTMRTCVRRGVVLALLLGLAPAAAARDWPTFAGGPRRLFFNPARTPIPSKNVHGLHIKWTFPTGAIVTASPSVAEVKVPGEGRVQVAFIQSWDHTLYALRTRDGTALWRLPLDDQPGAPYPNVASADVRTIDGKQRVFIAAGENVYAIDAPSGREVWRFSAGTGCASPPGLCGFAGERNEVESSPIVGDGKVLFGMDVNEGDGKGGFYAVDARDGRLVWYFDLETGATCKALPGDDVRRCDGYHPEEELGPPAGLLASRPGCGFARTRPGSGREWPTARTHGRR